MKKLRYPEKIERLDLAKHCFTHTGKLANYLSDLYGREGALKVFDLIPLESIEELRTVKWGDDPKPGTPRKNTTIWEATQIQNILSWYNLAPRIYALDVVSINGKMFPVQLMEWQEGITPTQQQVNDVIRDCVDLGYEYCFNMETNRASSADVIGGKLVDPQLFKFNVSYEETVRRIYQANQYGSNYYQDVPELSLNSGPRKSKQREIDLGLDRIDFKGKTVVDVGCAGGYFTRVAIDRGAKSADGLDMKGQIESARNVANCLGYFGNNYYVTDLSKEGLKLNYDIVFFLSLNFHIGIPKAILDAPMVIFEDNGRNTRHLGKLESPWTEHFSRIEYIGRASDHGDKCIYHLYK